jgi:tRNA A37 threonylcarbamoyladenosine modification protein TsaB
MNIPLIGVSTFSAVAGRVYRMFNKTGLLILSRKDEYYFGLIDSEHFDDSTIRIISSKELDILPDNLNLIAVDFEFESRFGSNLRIIKADQFEISAEDYIDRAKNELAAGRVENLSALEPLYIQKFRARL